MKILNTNTDTTIKNLKKLDGSFNIEVNGMPYNTIQGDRYFEEILSLYNSNPELFDLEKENIIDIEVLKLNKIEELKTNCKNYIYSVYSSEKQKNIDSELLMAFLNNSEDLEIKKQNSINMRNFIDTQRKICNQKEIEINNCKTEEDLDLIEITFGII